MVSKKQDQSSSCTEKPQVRRAEVVSDDLHELLSILPVQISALFWLEDN